MRPSVPGCGSAMDMARSAGPRPTVPAAVATVALDELRLGIRMER
ncbi:hypothetical protein [Streptomyces sp. NPDC005828]